MAVGGVPRWVRTLGPEARALPAGEWWDAVRVPLHHGRAALERLGASTGAVIEDGYGAILYWLIRPSSAPDWHLPPTHLLGPGCHVALPPAYRTAGPGLYWRIPPSARHNWTCPGKLGEALRATLP
ncbi:hypothetical protein [Streptomyces minutiscleroticus]|uniref:hypothetical protein n=1 Tax=Streptomyces minutiscleroticus TaxID=68238 RepID=UPI00333128F0